MSVLAVDWNQMTIGIFVAAALVSLGVGLWRIGPAGSQTVQTLKDLNETLRHKVEAQDKAMIEQSETIGDRQDEAHRLELVVKDKETDIARLEERPNTETIFSEIQASSAANLDAIRQVAGALEANTDVLLALEKHITRSADTPDA